MGGFYSVRQSLDADRGLRSTIGVITALVLISGWAFWLFQARITRYELSDSARLEVAAEVYPVEAEVSGRLIHTELTLGKEVHAGDVLAELDSESERLNLQEERARYAALEPQLAALKAQIPLEKQGGADERRVLGISIVEARAQYQEAEAKAGLAENEAKRAMRLKNEGLIPLADAQRAEANAQSSRAAAENLKTAISRLEPELQVREADREVKQKQALADVAKLEADLAVSAANIRRLEYESGRRLIRAPISGRLADCAPLRPGAEIVEGAKLGTIVPSSRLRAIAEFSPNVAIGKIRPGQRAEIRMQGFPWTQYGTIRARVSRVAGEVRDGKVRVELAVSSQPHSAIPFQHGLPGTVEVEIERISPAALLLRSAAGLLTGAH